MRVVVHRDDGSLGVELGEETRCKGVRVRGRPRVLGGGWITAG